MIYQEDSPYRDKKYDEIEYANATDDQRNSYSKYREEQAAYDYNMDYLRKNNSGEKQWQGRDGFVADERVMDNLKYYSNSISGADATSKEIPKGYAHISLTQPAHPGYTVLDEIIKPKITYKSTVTPANSKGVWVNGELIGTGLGQDDPRAPAWKSVNDG